MKPSTEAVKNHLCRHGTITGLQALRELGVYRLSARVLELREQGMGIETEYVSARGKRFARYRYHTQTQTARSEMEGAA